MNIPKQPTIPQMPREAKSGQTVTEIFEQIKFEICDHYCKYPNEWDEEAEGMELSESDICWKCPLSRL